MSPIRFSWASDEPVTKIIHSPKVEWLRRFSTRMFRAPSPRKIFIVSFRERGLLALWSVREELPLTDGNIVVCDGFGGRRNPLNRFRLLGVVEIDIRKTFPSHPVFLGKIQFVLFTILSEIVPLPSQMRNITHPTFWPLLHSFREGLLWIYSFSYYHPQYLCKKQTNLRSFASSHRYTS